MLRLGELSFGHRSVHGSSTRRVWPILPKCGLNSVCIGRTNDPSCSKVACEGPQPESATLPNWGEDVNVSVVFDDEVEDISDGYATRCINGDLVGDFGRYTIWFALWDDHTWLPRFVWDSFQSDGATRGSGQEKGPVVGGWLFTVPNVVNVLVSNEVEVGDGCVEVI